MGVHHQTRSEKNAARRHESFLTEIADCWTELAAGLTRSGAAPPAQATERLSRQVVELVLFLRLGRVRRAAIAEDCLPGLSSASQAGKGIPDGLARWIATAEERLGPALVPAAEFDFSAFSGGDASVAAAMARLGSPRIAECLAVAPTEVLGWIHQRLLNLRLVPSDAGLAASTTQSPKKAAGVVYTPPCVIRYMVARAVATPTDPPGFLTAQGPDNPADGGQQEACVRPALRILDPACGCGFFLLETCRWLSEWRRRHGQGAAGHWIAQCLHGADVDAEAVLAARRALWLELVVGGRETVSADQAGAILAELARNVRCGDALADSTWPDGLAQFDVVLGNPPYRRELNAKHLLDPLAGTSWGRRYRAPRMDLWYYFVHRGLELLKPGGRLSFIVDSYWTSSRGAAKLVAALQKDAWIEEVFSLGRARVFAGVSGRHMILSLVKGESRPTTTIKRAAAPQAGDAEAILAGSLPLQVFEKTPTQLFRGGRVDLEPPADGLLAKLESWPPLRQLGLVRQGIVENPASVTARASRQHGGRWRPGEGVFALTSEEAAALALPEAESRLLRPYHDLADLGRYFLAASPSRTLIYSTAETWPRVDAFPALLAHLQRFRPIMEARRETRLGLRPWWQLHWPREERIWRAAKLLCVQMAPRPAFVAAAGPAYVPFSVNGFVPHDGTRESLDYLAALLNSRLLWKWFSHHAKRRGVGLEVNGHVLAEAPIRTIDFTCGPQRDAHGRLADLGRALAQATGRWQGTQPAAEKTAIERHIAETERAIDLAVYALYGLTDAEIAAVDNADLTR